MDMKSYDLKRFPDFLLVPYRPVSGNLAKDLKNSFVFTCDSLQVSLHLTLFFKSILFSFLTLICKLASKLKLLTFNFTKKLISLFFRVNLSLVFCPVGS